MGRVSFPVRFPPRRCTVAAACAVLLVAARATCGTAPVVVNEIYYDHPGSDRGWEFVELLNTGPTPVSLDGATIEFHNGAGAGWEVRWHGGAGDTIAAGGLFTVGGDSIAPPPDAVADLALQNGPDALRLVVAGATFDLVGYGGLDDPAYVETTPAAPVAPGRSIGRVPDGGDSDDNAADFHELIPSPGGFNVPRRDAAVVPVAPTRVRAVLAESGVERLHLDVVNRGIEPVAAGAVTLTVTDSSAAGAETLDGRAVDVAIAPGGSAAVDIGVALAAGYHALRALVALDGDERSYNDAVILLRRVGSLGLVVSEVLSAPRDGCPQFVELYNAGAVARSLADFTIRDRTHAPSLVTGADVTLAPGAVAVLTPDTTALARCFGRVDGAIEVAGTWPTINRSGAGVADSVVVLDPPGLVVDAVAVPPVPTSARGRSLERVDVYEGGPAVWLVSTDPAGATPGRVGVRSLFAPPAPGDVRAEPNPFAPGRGETLAISLGPTPPGTRADVRVFDLRGRVVADLGSTAAFPAVFLWDGRRDGGAAAPPGLYVVAVAWSAPGGTRVEKVVVGRGAGAR